MRTNYVLKVGSDGAPRLKLLNDMCNPSSLEFIEKNIELRGKKILDLGCGIGILSCELASRCLPEGEVIAADISQEQLDIAESNAKEAGLKNIIFRKVSAYEIDELGIKFDLIYCRFVLAHLGSVDDIISKITTIMSENGILICEEPNNVASLYCDPPEPIFERWKKAAIQQVKISGADFSIGESLHSIFGQNNLAVIQSRKTQAMLKTSDLKQQLWQGLIEISALLIQSNFASESEIQQMIEELKDFANTSQSEVGYLECTQIAVRKL